MILVSETHPYAHVVPVDDRWPHELIQPCWCNAEVDERDKVITHNSLDRREMYESLPPQ